MKEQYLNKETYERTALEITVFSKEDVIVTSGESGLFKFLFGDNDTMFPNR